MPSSWTNTDKLDDEALLKEDDFYLLLETGDKILINEASDWTDTTKNSSSWTNTSKI